MIATLPSSSWKDKIEALITMLFFLFVFVVWVTIGTIWGRVFMTDEEWEVEKEYLARKGG